MKIAGTEPQSLPITDEKSTKTEPSSDTFSGPGGPIVDMMAYLYETRTLTQR